MCLPTVTEIACKAQPRSVSGGGCALPVTIRPAISPMTAPHSVWAVSAPTSLPMRPSLPSLLALRQVVAIRPSSSACSVA